MIFGMGDGASLGYIQAVETAKNKTWYIGDIGNIAPIDKKKIQLSSVLWNFTGAYKQAIKDINAGTFGVKAYDLDLKNGGIALLKTSYIPGRDLGARQQGAEGHHRRARSRCRRRPPRARSTSSSRARRLEQSGEAAADRARRPPSQPRDRTDTPTPRRSDGRPCQQAPAFVELRGITKRYPGVVANDDV